MRSHPYTPPPPRPPILNELIAMLPNHNPNPPAPDEGSRRGSGSRSGSGEIPLSDLDPETSNLLPARRKRHQVRVQGRLALVRSVSTANLRPSPTTPGEETPPMPSPNTRIDPAVGSAMAPPRRRRRRKSSRRRSLSDAAGPARDANGGGGSGGGSGSGSDSDTETGEDERETQKRDRQLRGYGIGGAGNIRRPTEVIHFTSSKRTASPSLLASLAPSSLTAGTERKRWNLMNLLNRRGDQKGKAPATP